MHKYCSALSGNSECLLLNVYENKHTVRERDKTGPVRVASLRNIFSRPVRPRPGPACPAMLFDPSRCQPQYSSPHLHISILRNAVSPFPSLSLSHGRAAVTLLSLTLVWVLPFPLLSRWIFMKTESNGSLSTIPVGNLVFTILNSTLVLLLVLKYPGRTLNANPVKSIELSGWLFSGK